MVGVTEEAVFLAVAAAHTRCDVILFRRSNVGVTAGVAINGIVAKRVFWGRRAGMSSLALLTVFLRPTCCRCWKATLCSLSLASMEEANWASTTSMVRLSYALGSYGNTGLSEA